MSNEQFNEMHQTLARIREAISEETRYLEMLQKQNIISTEKTIKAINDLLRSQQETELVKAFASVAAKGTQYFEEERTIDYEQKLLDEKIGKIIENYLDQQNKLDTELDARIRRIGEHIFRIVEEEGEKAIDEVSKVKQEAFEETSRKIKEIYSYKIQRLQESFSTPLSNIDSFMRQRKGMVDQIQSLLIDKAVDRSLRLFVPFWLVEVYDCKTKETTRTLYGPSDVQFADGITITPIEGYDFLKAKLEENIDQVSARLVKSEYGLWEAAKSGIENLRKRGLIKQNVANRLLKEDRIMGFDEVAVKGENLS